MTGSSTHEEQKALLRMVCDRPKTWHTDTFYSHDWLVLNLPDGRYAAFWGQGLEISLCSSVVAGDFDAGCAFIGSTKEDVLRYIRDSDATEG